MSFSPAALHAVLQAHVPAAATGLVVAVSGGADSASLLAALAQPRFGDLPLRAVHVDHALQPAAAGLREACETLCRRLGVPLTVIAVAVAAGNGASIEEAARDARYGGLGRELRFGECLLTAHHAEDQAETVLLQLLRGAGLPGLCAMPVCRPWNRGWHLRPLLEVAQRDLREFGAAAGVAALPDPMNFDTRFDRVHLRLNVWPSIEERWPGAAVALSRTSRHLAEAQGLLDHTASLAVGRLRDGATLSVAGLRALSRPERINVVRHWLRSSGTTPPPAARLAEALRQIIAADPDHLPSIEWEQHALRRYRERLYLTAAQAPVIGEPCEWPVAAGATLNLGSGLGTLQWLPQMGGLDRARLPDSLIVRRRLGGERLKPARRARAQTVQHLCQSVGVVPWMRDALPMLCAGDDLVAVGDLWQDARWCVAPEVPGFSCQWLDAPTLV